nr:hypothetical protein [Streptomyces katrae]
MGGATRAAAAGIRVPSGRTAVWGTPDAGIVTDVKTPYGWAGPGGEVTWKPG